MKKYLIVFAAFCVAAVLGNPILSEPPLADGIDDIFLINEVIGKTTERQTRVAANCPSTKGCMHQCPLGYERDERGCPICEKCLEKGVFESDIVVDNETYADLKKQFGLECDNDKQVRGGLKDTSRHWPYVNGNPQVPYIFETYFTQEKKDNIMKAIAQYHSLTCIRFVPRTTQTNYIAFRNDSGCQSYVGMIGRKQQVWIGPGCDRKQGTIIHELMHALGFWHEQSRADRDNYVDIIWGNIKSGFDGNFQKQSTKVWDSYGSAYDYGSVMHYGSYFFSNQYNVLPTILMKGTQNTINYQRDGFSEQDLIQVNNMYKCTAYIGVKPTSTIAATTTTTKASTAAPGQCANSYSNCQSVVQFCTTSSYVRQVCRLTCGLCSVAQTTETVTTTPPATTTTTTTTTTAATTTTKSTGVCGDNSQSCKQWSINGHCTDKYRSYMEKNCKLSCGLCGNAATTTTRPTTTRAPTTTQGAVVTQPSSGKVCKDVYQKSSCDHWQEQGFCEHTHVAFMAKNCNKTCQLCNVQTTTLGEVCRDLNKNCKAWEGYGYCTKTYVSFMSKNCRATCGLCSTGATTTITPAVTVAQATYHGECGIPAVALSYRIVGGVAARKQANPWIASIRYANGYDLCGGSLVARKFIVTAAHCFGGTMSPTPSSYFAFLGKYTLSKDEYDQGQKRVNFKKITIHPGYVHRNSDNDIAVIELTEEVTYNDYIRPVCLPSSGEDPVPDTDALVAGWGDTGSTTQSNNVLLQVDVEIISTPVCNQWLNGLVTDNMFCAGYAEGKKDACQGDSGGPLVQRRGAAHYLIGVVSWGYGCAEAYRPGVYAKVSRSVDFINDVMEA